MMRVLSALLLVPLGALLTACSATPKPEPTATVEVVVRLTICAESTCSTVGLPEVDVSINLPGEPVGHERTDPTGSARFDVATTGIAQLVAKSPLLSQDLTTSINTAVQPESLVSVELIDPIPAHLDRVPRFE